MNSYFLKIRERLDTASGVVIVITFLLFTVSLFLKGLSRDILLEGGVLLVSVKLIIMSYKNNLNINEVNKQLGEIKKLVKKE